jgi:hypothetical protein
MCGHFKLIVASNKIVLLYSLNINWSVFEGSLNNSKITKTVNIVNNGICYLLVIIELCLIGDWVLHVTFRIDGINEFSDVYVLLQIIIYLIYFALWYCIL